MVAEVLNLASLPHFHVGGSIRIVLNNQLGYTTSKVHGRTSHYATDLAKSIGSPILHVNGDKVESVARAARLALQYQQKFAKDIVIDLVVYRRKGHNELDAVIVNLPFILEFYLSHSNTSFSKRSLIIRHLFSIERSRHNLLFSQRIRRNYSRRI